jgi:hypothetical protein
MAIAYPLSLPSTINAGQLTFRQRNVTVASRSPFTLHEQVIAQAGQAWEVDVKLPPGMQRDVAQDWVGFLASLRGNVGTFLLGDANATAPLGSVSGSPTFIGNEGALGGSVTMTGTLKRGDYIQLGTGSDARLHMVLKDASGSDSLDLWPSLRADYSSAPLIVTDTVGVFRKSDALTTYNINEVLSYGISFSAIEALG